MLGFQSSANYRTPKWKSVHFIKIYPLTLFPSQLSKTWFFKCLKSLWTVLDISLTIWHHLCLPGSFGVVLLSRSLNWFSPSFTNTTSLWKVLLTRPDYIFCHLWFVSLSFCITSRFSYLLIGSANWQQILLNDIGLWVEQKDVGRHFNKFVAKK